MANVRRRVTQIEPGMPVFAGDGSQVGALEDMDESALRVGTQRIPIEAVDRITAEGIYLHRDAAWPDATTVEPSKDRRTGAAGDAKGHKTVRVPVVEERLRVDTRPTEGEVEVRKTVEEMDQVVRLSLQRGEVEVQRVPVNRRIDAPVGQRMEGDWLIVPVLEEVLVVEKRLMLKEEIRIRTTPSERQEEVRERVRRERVDVVPVGDTQVRIVDAAPDQPEHQIPEQRPALAERRPRRTGRAQSST